MNRTKLIQKLQQLIDRLPISNKRKEAKEDLLSLKLNKSQYHDIMIFDKYKKNLQYVNREVKNKVVYLHRNKITDEVFYVGMGSKTRPYDKNKRNLFWNNYVNKYGFYVEIVKSNLSSKEASKEEVRLISLFGRKDLKEGSLVNLSNGGEGAISYKKTTDSKPCICLSSGKVYNSISEYCEDNNYAYTTILNFVKYNLNKAPNSYNVRLLRKDNSIIWEKKKDKVIDNSFSIDNSFDKECYNYCYDSDREFENKLNIIKNKIKHMDLSLVLCYLTNVVLNKSIREISKECNVSKNSIYTINNIVRDSLNGLREYGYRGDEFNRKLILNKYRNHTYLINKIFLDDIEFKEERFPYIQTKVCRKCNEVKSSKSFNIQKGFKDGRSNTCISCSKKPKHILIKRPAKRTKKWLEKNKN